MDPHVEFITSLQQYRATVTIKIAGTLRTYSQDFMRWSLAERAEFQQNAERALAPR